MYVANGNERTPRRADTNWRTAVALLLPRERVAGPGAADRPREDSLPTNYRERTGGGGADYRYTRTLVRPSLRFHLEIRRSRHIILISPWSCARRCRIIFTATRPSPPPRGLIKIKVIRWSDFLGFRALTSVFRGNGYARRDVGNSNPCTFYNNILYNAHNETICEWCVIHYLYLYIVILITANVTILYTYK